MKSLLTLILFLLWLFISSVHSQDYIQDSLLNIITTSNNPKSVAKASCELGFIMRTDNSKEALEYCEKGIRIAKENNFSLIIADGIRVRAEIKRIRGDHSGALDDFNEALSVAKKNNSKQLEASILNGLCVMFRDQGKVPEGLEKARGALAIQIVLKNKNDCAVVYNNMGELFRINSENDSAMYYYNKSMEIYKELDNRHGMADIYNNIGIVHDYKGEYDKGISNYLSAIKIYDELANISGKAGAMNNVGIIFIYQGKFEEARKMFLEVKDLYTKIDSKQGVGYALRNLGWLESEVGNFTLSIDYFKSTLEIKRNTFDSLGMVDSYSSLSWLYTQINKLDLAISYSKSAREILKSIGNRRSVLYALTTEAEIYFMSGESKKAIQNLEEALKLSKEMESLTEEQFVLKSLSEGYGLIKNFELAYKYHQEYFNVTDSLVGVESIKQINQLKEQYESEKKEMAIEKMEKQKELDDKTIEAEQARNHKQQIIIFSAIGGFLILLIFSSIILKMFRQKRKANILLAKQNDEIRMQKDEIISHRNEIEAQRDQLECTLVKLRETQTQLIESEKMASLGSLVAGVAHEINTPVGIGITASSALVDDTKLFADKYKAGQMDRQLLEQFLENVFSGGKLILRNMMRTGDLVKTFKQVSIEQYNEQICQFNIKEYFNGIFYGLKSQLDTKLVSVHIDCEDELIINSYPGVWALILNNLVSNSLVHGFAEKIEGNIFIEISKESNNITIVYKDDGCGILGDILPQIFDPFFTTDKQKGVGLGLHIVFNLVTHKLLGKIECRNTDEKATEFVIRFVNEDVEL